MADLGQTGEMKLLTETLCYSLKQYDKKGMPAHNILHATAFTWLSGVRFKLSMFIQNWEDVLVIIMMSTYV